MKLPGYMTASEARASGFTHHGSYYGIPLWLGDLEGEAPLVATKFAPLELLMSVFHIIEGIVSAICWPDDEPAFMLKVGDPIEP